MSFISQVPGVIGAEVEGATIAAGGGRSRGIAAYSGPPYTGDFLPVFCTVDGNIEDVQLFTDGLTGDPLGVSVSPNLGVGAVGSPQATFHVLGSDLLKVESFYDAGAASPWTGPNPFSVVSGQALWLNFQVPDPGTHTVAVCFTIA